MWAQMLKTRMKPGQEDTAQQLPQEMEERFRNMGGGGPQRVVVMQDQHNPDEYYTLIFFESEEQARQFENGPQQQAIQQRMMQIWEGPPEYTDLNVVFDITR
ncbi:MAG TPA: antibiotic biosynthesis monooxygenase [Chloroflexota bacterium]|nr:antibiotic biosynthesis monooxygenase [Chloroflexota bacterium]